MFHRLGNDLHARTVCKYRWVAPRFVFLLRPRMPPQPVHLQVWQAKTIEQRQEFVLVSLTCVLATSSVCVRTRRPSKVIHAERPRAIVAVVIHEHCTLLLGHSCHSLTVPLPRAGRRYVCLWPRLAAMQCYTRGLVQPLTNLRFVAGFGVHDDLALLNDDQTQQVLQQTTAIRLTFESDAANTLAHQIQVLHSAQLHIGKLPQRGLHDQITKELRLLGTHG